MPAFKIKLNIFVFVYFPPFKPSPLFVLQINSLLNLMAKNKNQTFVLLEVFHVVGKSNIER